MTSADLDRATPAPSERSRARSAVALVRPSDARHGPIAQLLVASAPLGLILVAYYVARWISAPLQLGDGAAVNRLGFGLHVAGPADADRVLFGAVPTVWLQERLVDGSSHWYDAAAALVYVTHFIAIPVLTAAVWFRIRERFVPWVLTVLAFAVIGTAGYVVYPAAPPWLAAEQGVIGTVDRISALGWEHLGLDAVARLTVAGQDGSNPVAAMPSLHAGAALLVALFLWRSAGTWWRGALGTYTVAMALTLVYTGEHYVADVLAGWATAAVAHGVGTAVGRRGGSRDG